MDTNLSPNTLAMLALANEYCVALQNCREIAEESAVDDADGQPTYHPFLRSVVKLLPRLYVCATDMAEQAQADSDLAEDVYIDQALTEDYYDTVRRNVEYVLGPDDTYLEVFHQDMKYSDTPIAASIAEGLADLFQVFYNFLETVRDAPDHVVMGAVGALAEDFRAYWSMTLCNVLRAVNQLYYQ